MCATTVTAWRTIPMSRQNTDSRFVTVHYCFHPLAGQSFRCIRVCTGPPATYLIELSKRRYFLPAWMAEKRAGEVELLESPHLDIGHLLVRTYEHMGKGIDAEAADAFRIELTHAVKELAERHGADDTTIRGTAMAELESMVPRGSQYLPGEEIPEKHWMYRLAKKYWFRIYTC